MQTFERFSSSIRSEGGYEVDKINISGDSEADDYLLYGKTLEHREQGATYRIKKRLVRKIPNSFREHSLLEASGNKKSNIPTW